METGIYHLIVPDEFWSVEIADWLTIPSGYYILEPFGNIYFGQYWVTDISTGEVKQLELRSNTNIWKQVSMNI